MSLPPSKPNSHIELENHIRSFQNKLGNDWDKYQETLSLFLIGKLSRNEMVEIITPLLNKKSDSTGGDGTEASSSSTTTSTSSSSSTSLVKYHNKLLLMNFANSLIDGPLDPNSEFASFWNKKNSTGKPKNVKSSQYEKFKQNIMGLPIRERRRIKNITRESGKKGKLAASITLTRHLMLPKIPMIQDKQQQQSHVNNLVAWQQDVVNGINTPIATENYEIPDYDNLSRRMIMIMREYGLTGGLNPQVMEVLLLGLEVHLKNIVESAIDVARYRESKYASNDYLGTGEMVFPGGASDSSITSTKNNATPGSNGSQPIRNGNNIGNNREDEITQDRKRQKITLNAEDLYDTLEMFPYLVEPSGPKLRLANVLLQNDDMVKAGELDYELPEKLDLLESLVNGKMEEANENKEEHKEKEEIKEEAEKENSVKKLDDTVGEIQDGEGKEDKEEITKKEVVKSTGKEINPVTTQKIVPKPESHIGTNDELKWLLHDLISTM